MESDLSLIEISREDDSLLCPQQIANGDFSSLNNNDTDFSCSPLPLQIPKSNHSMNRTPIENTRNPSSSACKEGRDSVNKENVNANKQELLKLSIEPQQMKRKKKGGGYNLRKSLAWDRAFFTDEGVLDPLELSMLSGNFGKSSGDMLSVIDEGRESMSGDSVSDSPNLQAIEGNLFKKLPVSASHGGKKIAGILSPKPGSSARDKVAPAPVAKRKILSAHDLNRSASKRSGCPRPGASSSPPIPSANTTKVATKDSKVSKMLTPKQGPLVVPTTSKSSISSFNHSKHSQISQTVVNAHINIGLKNTSTNTKSNRNGVKTGPSGKVISKLTVQQARRNAIKSSVPEIDSSANGRHPRVSQTNNEVVPEPILPAAAHPPEDNDGNTCKIPVSLSQNASYNGGNMQSTQTPIAKPSGLRLPSPSLGFFGQSKPSGSHSLFQRSTQACNRPQSSIPSANKLRSINPIDQRYAQSSVKFHASLGMGCSVVSVLNSASNGKFKSRLESDNMQKLEVQVPLNTQSADMIGCQQRLNTIHDDVDMQSSDHAEQCKLEKISHTEDIGLEKNDKELLLQSGPCKQLKKDVDSEMVDDIHRKNKDLTGYGLDSPHFAIHGSDPVEAETLSDMNILIANKHAKDRLYDLSIKNHSVCSEPKFFANNNGDEGTQKVHEDQLSSLHKSNKQSGQQAEPMKSDTCETDMVYNAESCGLRISSSNSFEERRYSEGLSTYDSLNAADANLNVQDCTGSKLETSFSLSQCKHVEHTEDSISGADNLSKELHLGYAQVLSADGNLTVESGANIPSTSTLDNSDSMVIDGLGEKSSEQAELPNPCPELERVSHNNYESHSDGCLLHDKSFSPEETQEKNVLKSVKSDLSTSTVACRGELKRSSSFYSIPLLKQDCGLVVAGKVKCLHAENALADSGLAVENFSDDLELHGESTSLEPETPHLTSQLGSVVQVQVLSDVNDSSELKGVVCKQCDFSVKNFIALSDLLPENNPCCNERSISIPHSDCFSGMHDLNEQSVEAAKMTNSCFHEAETKNKIEEIYDVHLFDERSSFEDSRKFDDCNTADVSVTGESGLESLHGLCQCDVTDHANEKNMVEESVIKDVQVQPLDSCQLADSCNCEQPEEHTELQGPNLVIEKAPLQNRGLCSDDNVLHLNVSSVESQEREAIGFVLGVVSEKCNGCASDDVCVQTLPAMQDAGLGMDTKAANPLRDDTFSCSIEIEPSIEHIDYYMDGKYENGGVDCDQTTTLEFDSSSMKNRDHISLAANACDSKPFCASEEKSELPAKTYETSCRGILQDIEVNLLFGEAEINGKQNNSCSNSKLLHREDNSMRLSEDKDAMLSLKKSVNDKKPDTTVIKPPPNATPFSDEWLAAFEAAGEGILTMKGGAVQNSPPDKSAPEPGPWSPVRRKHNQGIGPFDCTKFTNNSNPPSTSD